MSRLVVMGSGETAPTMVKVHREVLRATHERAGEGPAAFVDTAFGFQTNADELTTRTLQYFADSVGHEVEVARWRRADEPLAQRERSLSLLGRSVWAFAGPGSPSYALRQWAGTDVPDAFAGVVERGGTLVLGSAAAVTLGSHAVPVYEVYKVGEEPHWLPGLDLLERFTGIRAAVVPHYDNAEGGSHDTRFCYLGEERLSRLEGELPEGTGVLGVDEHTAVWLDLATREVRVVGSGALTVRRAGASLVVEAGRTLALDELRELVATGRRTTGSGSGAGPHGDPSGEQPGERSDTPSPEPATRPGGAPDEPAAETSLRATAERCRRDFDTAVAARDADGAVTAVLELEQAVRDWSSDTFQSDETDVARRVLRSMVSDLGRLAAVGAADPRDAVAPFVDLLLELRDRARAARDFEVADRVRDGLVQAGVEVRDTTDGVGWSLRDRG